MLERHPKWRRSQGVKAGDCKSPIVGSNPTVASTPLCLPPQLLGHAIMTLSPSSVLEEAMKRILALVAAMSVIVLGACGGGGEEAITLDGNTITKKEFQAIKKTAVDFLKGFADEDWDKVHSLLDSESQRACPRFEFVTAAATAVGLIKNFAGEEGWRSMANIMRDMARVFEELSWDEFQKDPEAFLAALDERLARLMGDGGGVFSETDQGQPLADLRIEEGQARIHLPDICEALLSG